MSSQYFNSYPFQYEYQYDLGIFDLVSGVIFSAIFAFLLVSFLVYFVFYIFESVGYHKILKNRGYSKAYLAYIPYFRTYIKGALADDINIKSCRNTSYGVILGFCAGFECVFTASLILSALFSSRFLAFLFLGLTFVVKTISIIFKYFALNVFYKDYQNENQLLLIIFSVLLPILPAIVVFVSKDIRPISLGGTSYKQTYQQNPYTDYKY